MEALGGNVLRFAGSPAYPQGFPAFLATQVQQRIKHRDRFALAPSMLFTARAAEQATGDSIAGYKTCFLGRPKRVLVACCGLGGELMHLVRAFPEAEMVAVDADLHVLALAAWNVLLVQDAPRVTFVHGRLEEVLAGLGTFDGCYFDPDRRPGGARRLALADYVPNPLTMLPLLRTQCASVHTKVSPMITNLMDAAPAGWTWIEEDWTLKECVLHHGPGDFPLFAHLEGGEVLEELALTQGPETEVPHLVELSPVLLRAGLVEEVAHQLNATRLHPKSSLLLTSRPSAHPLLRYYVVEEKAPFAPKLLKKRLRGKSFVVKKRFFPLEPQEILRVLGLVEGGDRVLFCTTVDPGTRVAFFCKRGIVGP